MDRFSRASVFSIAFGLQLPTAFYFYQWRTYRYNTLGPKQNCRRFSDGIFKYIFLKGNLQIRWIWMRFVSRVWINNIPALIQMMAWRQPGHLPNQLWLGYWHTYASFCVNELTNLMKLLWTQDDFWILSNSTFQSDSYQGAAGGLQ